MTRIKRPAVAVLLGLLSLGTIGCANQAEQDLAALQQDYNALQARNEALEGQLDECRSNEANLLTQLDGAQRTIEQRNATIQDLRQQLASKPEPQPQPQPQPGDGWEIGEFGDRVTVGSDILFSSGRATLTADGKSKLNTIAQTLKREYPDKQVRVIGYTDNDPIRKTRNLWEDNLDLSANRAMTVVRHLREQGIDAEKLTACGRGETNPVTPNTSTANKAKNRRVEIIVIK